MIVPLYSLVALCCKQTFLQFSKYLPDGFTWPVGLEKWLKKEPTGLEHPTGAKKERKKTPLYSAQLEILGERYSLFLIFINKLIDINFKNDFVNTYETIAIKVLRFANFLQE